MQLHCGLKNSLAYRVRSSVHTVLNPVHQALCVGVLARHQEFDVQACAPALQSLGTAEQSSKVWHQAILCAVSLRSSRSKEYQELL